MATRSSVLAWRIPGTGEPGGLPSLGSHRVGHDWSDLAAAAYVKNSFQWFSRSKILLFLSLISISSNRKVRLSLLFFPNPWYPISGKQWLLRVLHNCMPFHAGISCVRTLYTYILNSIYRWIWKFVNYSKISHNRLQTYSYNNEVILLIYDLDRRIFINTHQNICLYYFFDALYKFLMLYVNFIQKLFRF